MEINSLGTPESRGAYRDELVRYFSAVKNRLDEDSIRRLDKNPLRILDSKNPELAELIENAPVMADFLDEESAAHFARLCELLEAAQVPYTVNPRLVRGLDYYSRTVFEWLTDALGAQGAVCSGGRYDGLVEKLGGRPTPAIGWAMGMERLVELYEACGGETLIQSAPGVYLVAVGDAAVTKSFSIAEELRDGIPGVRVATNLGGGSFKAQLKRADKSGAEYAVLIGDDELASGEAGVKPLRRREEQMTVAFDDVVDEIRQRLAKAVSLDGGLTRETKVKQWKIYPRKNRLK